jgi:integrase
MSRFRIPKLRKQEEKGRPARAFVEIDGKRKKLGVWGTPEVTEAYARLIAEWEANNRRLPVEPTAEDPTLILDIVVRYWDWAKAEYAAKPANLQHIRAALRPLRDLYGTTPAGEFGPKKLKAIQHTLSKQTDSRTGELLCRSTVNMRVKYIKRVFKWAVGEEIIPASVYQALETVDGLRRGKAREGEPVKPVPVEWVEAVRPYVSEPVEALIDLQLLTGARPGELVKLRAVDIDRSGKIWTYKPEQHKTAHHDEERVIAFPPKAQEILKRFIKTSRPITSPLFSPREAEAERNKEKRAGRKTPMTPSQRKRREHARRRKLRRRQPGDQYSVDSYRRAIQYACDQAFALPKHLRRRDDESESGWWKRLTDKERAEVRAFRRDHRWHPHQLRHTSGTYVRHQFGLEAAQVWLGHKSLGMTEVYAEKNQAALLEIARKIG